HAPGGRTHGRLGGLLGNTHKKSLPGSAAAIPGGSVGPGGAAPEPPPPRRGRVGRPPALGAYGRPTRGPTAGVSGTAWVLSRRLEPAGRRSPGALPKHAGFADVVGAPLFLVSVRGDAVRAALGDGGREDFGGQFGGVGAQGLGQLVAGGLPPQLDAVGDLQA